MSLILTTSRNPSIRTRQFLKEFLKLFPKSRARVVNRGKFSLQDLFLRHSTASLMMIVSNYQGNPNKISFFFKKMTMFEWVMDWKIAFIKLHFELDKQINEHPHHTQISFENVDQNLVEILTNVFKSFIGNLNKEINAKREDQKVIITFSYENPGFLLAPSLSKEKKFEMIGPQIMIHEIIINEE